MACRQHCHSMSNLSNHGHLQLDYRHIIANVKCKQGKKLYSKYADVYDNAHIESVNGYKEMKPEEA